jgi:uncharacterized membrane protein YGL010W
MMKSYQQWMDEYALDHTHPINQTIHKICVPLIMFSVIGLLWSIPRVAFFTLTINWAFLLMIPAIFFYFSLKNISAVIMMIIQFVVMSLLSHFLYERQVLLSVSLIIFIIAWIGQFIGHKIEGRKPSFLQDIFFLLIGPLWVNHALLKKFK